MPAIGILIGFAMPARAQCPDGSPPPCAVRRNATAVPAAPDPSRIVVLPFRVATADTLLGEGIAELVAAEFQGSSGLKAVHMGSVLSAWRHAGGGPRTPLPQENSVRLARSLGAGLIVDGSVVGVGQRLTISTTVIRSSDGLIRRASPVSGSADSLDALTNRVIVGVMAAAGGEARSGGDDRGRTTSSPAAMRSYLEGLADLRRGELDAASSAFERALDSDSTFARAAFRRLEIAIWLQDSTVQTSWGPLAWSFRDRLSRPDRAVLESFLGPRFPARTPSAEWLAAADRATKEAPESPEAWYQYGDLIYHSGGVQEADPITHALALFERSYELDSQETVLEHLVEGSLLTGDTALLRRLNVAPLIEHFTPLAWFAASQAGDSRTLATLRRREGPWVGGLPLGGLYGASRASVEELMNILVTQRHEQRIGFYWLLVSQGRPRAAQAFVETRAPDATASRDVMLVEAGAWGDADTAAARAADARLAAYHATSARGAAAVGCVRAQWQYVRNVRVDVDEAVVQRGNPLCARMIDLMKAAQANAPDLDARLAETDSVVRESIFGEQWASNGFEGLVLAKLWAARGDNRRALNAIRLRVEGILTSSSVFASIKAEGPIAEAAGDTVGAIRAYRRFLRMRGDPEPELRAQRDSAVAAIARLERRTPVP